MAELFSGSRFLTVYWWVIAGIMGFVAWVAGSMLALLNGSLAWWKRLAWVLAIWVTAATANLAYCAIYAIREQRAERNIRGVSR